MIVAYTTAHAGAGIPESGGLAAKRAGVDADAMELSTRSNARAIIPVALDDLAFTARSNGVGRDCAR